MRDDHQDVEYLDEDQEVFDFVVLGRFFLV